jgi:hypothetical protein
MISLSNKGIGILASKGSFDLASISLCLNGLTTDKGFFESSFNNYIKNSFLVSLINLMIFSFLGSLTSI